MAYLTVSELVAHIGIKTLLRILHARLDGAVNQAAFEARVANSGVSAFYTQDIERVDAAIAVINTHIADVDALIHGFVLTRYELGLTEAQIAESVLPGIAAKLVKVSLMPSADDDARHDEKSATELLKLIAKGQLNVGGNDPEPVSQKNSIRVGRSHSSIDWERFGR